MVFCVTARRDTVVRTRLSRLILLAAIGSPIGRQFPYVIIDWSFFCVLEAISRPISNRWNRVTSGTSGRSDVAFCKVRPLLGIWSEIVAHVSVYVATLNVLGFSEPVNKLPVCTPERHLKHHVNLTINNHNYGGPQLPHQNQMHTAKNTNRSQQITNRSQQIQIAHSKLQIAHSKLQIAHSKFKSPTANSNRSQ